ncbi:hypothetical protein CHUAL_010731 [Chamberlinius hualienensis]
MNGISDDVSPLKWKKPSDVMKLRQMKLKRKKLERRLGILDGETTVDCDQKNTIKHNIESAFINPFRCSNNKRLKTDDVADTSTAIDIKGKYDFSEVSFLQRLHETEVVDRALNSSYSLNDSESFDQTQYDQSEIDGEVKKLADDKLPVDWSLKCGIRMTSGQPFPWSCRLTTPEEASGVTSFTRCLPLCGGGLLSVQLDTSPNSQLLQCCKGWMHPSFPWLSLFPRQQQKKSMINSTTPPLPSQFHKTLYSDWCNSFRSLFHLLRARQCPYFYLCANEFTALFRASGIGSNPQVHAFVTPSSTGLRAALNEEGVDFTMPLAPKAEVELSVEADETEEWLKSVSADGLVVSQEKLSNKKGNNLIDYQPQSLLYVVDSNVQGLFNYLLNSKRCTSNTGSHAGVPPTLLSPVAFTGGTLRNLQMRHRQSDKFHTLDITGPILPHTVHYLYNLLKSRSPSGDFELMLSTVNESASFSNVDQHIQLQSTAPPVFSQQGLNDCGLEADVLQTMCLPTKTLVLSHIKIEKGQTTCT